MKSPWRLTNKEMPEEFKMEEDTLQGHREWTESKQVLVYSPLCGYYVDATRNGKWRSSKYMESCYIVAWMEIPKIDEEEI